MDNHQYSYTPGASGWSGGTLGSARPGQTNVQFQQQAVAKANPQRSVSPIVSLDTSPRLQDQSLVLTPAGFKPLSKEERDEMLHSQLEIGFSLDGYQVVRREFFSHKFDPTLTFKGNSVIFNNACISRMDNVVYIQLLINPEKEKLVIRPCQEGARDAIRWCIAKEDKRKSRQIACGIFAAKIYELMGWEQLYRYKLQGTKINYKGEDLYVFDLTSTEIFLPQSKDSETGKVRRAAPFYPVNWRDSFGLPVMDHAASTQVDLMDGYGLLEVSEGGMEAGEMPEQKVEQMPMEIIEAEMGEVARV